VFRFKIGTGHYEYPTNKLNDATVEILLMSSDIEIKNLVVTSDDYLVVGTNPFLLEQDSAF
jgi:hypothetical protein